MCRCGASPASTTSGCPSAACWSASNCSTRQSSCRASAIPLNAAYVLGPERSGLSPALLAQCRHVVRIPTRFALNLAVAGALVLYDRLLQHGRFADRPVHSGGAEPLRPASAHGDPVFRRHLPTWLARAPRDGEET